MHISKIDNFYQNTNNKTFQGKVIFDEQFTKKYSQHAKRELKKGISRIERSTSPKTVVEYSLKRVNNSLSTDSYSLSGYRKVSNSDFKYPLIESIDDILYSNSVQDLEEHSINPKAEIQTLFSNGPVYKERFWGLLPSKYEEDYSLQDGADMDKKLLQHNILQIFKDSIKCNNKDKFTYDRIVELINVTADMSNLENLFIARDNFIKKFKSENNIKGKFKKLFKIEINKLFNYNTAISKIDAINKQKHKNDTDSFWDNIG